MSIYEFLDIYGNNKIYFSKCIRNVFFYNIDRIEISGTPYFDYEFFYEMSINDFYKQVVSFTFIIQPPDE